MWAKLKQFFISFCQNFFCIQLTLLSFKFFIFAGSQWFLRLASSKFYQMAKIKYVHFWTHYEGKLCTRSTILCLYVSGFLWQVFKHQSKEIKKQKNNKRRIFVAEPVYNSENAQLWPHNPNSRNDYMKWVTLQVLNTKFLKQWNFKQLSFSYNKTFTQLSFDFCEQKLLKKIF